MAWSKIEEVLSIGLSSDKLRNVFLKVDEDIKASQLSETKPIKKSRIKKVAVSEKQPSVQKSLENQKPISQASKNLSDIIGV